MIKIYDSKKISLDEILIRENAASGVEDIVSDIIRDVRKNGDAALYKYAEKFDKVSLSSLEVTKEEIDEVVEATMKGGATLTKMLGTSAWEAPAQGITEVVKSIAWDEWNTIPSSVYHPSVGLCIGDLVAIGDTGWNLEYDGSDESKAYMKEYAHKAAESVEAIRKVNAALS